jgi:hypothetical protein
LNENEKALEASDESLDLSPHSFKAFRTRALLNLNLENRTQLSAISNPPFERPVLREVRQTLTSELSSRS